jgi:hypothetical protein
MVYLLKMLIFYSYVSLPEGNHFQKSMWNTIFWVQKLKTLQDESLSFMFDVPICLAPCSPQRQSERQIKGFDFSWGLSG